MRKISILLALVFAFTVFQINVAKAETQLPYRLKISGWHFENTNAKWAQTLIFESTCPLVLEKVNGQYGYLYYIRILPQTFLQYGNTQSWKLTYTNKDGSIGVSQNTWTYPNTQSVTTTSNYNCIIETNYDVRDDNGNLVQDSNMKEITPITPGQGETLNSFPDFKFKSSFDGFVDLDFIRDPTPQSYNLVWSKRVDVVKDQEIVIPASEIPWTNGAYEVIFHSPVNGQNTLLRKLNFTITQVAHTYIKVNLDNPGVKFDTGIWIGIDSYGKVPFTVYVNDKAVKKVEKDGFINVVPGTDFKWNVGNNKVEIKDDAGNILWEKSPTIFLRDDGYDPGTDPYPKDGGPLEKITWALDSVVQIFGSLGSAIGSLFQVTGQMGNIMGQFMSFVPQEIRTLLVIGVMAAIVLRFLGR